MGDPELEVLTPRPPNRFTTAAGVVLLVLIAGYIAMRWVRMPESTRAMRGEVLARELGCFACHGPGGLGGVADPSSPSGAVPAWTPKVAPSYVTSEQDIRDWIVFGRPQQHPHDPSPHLVPMPAYGDLLSSHQVDELVAYFKAVSGWTPGIPNDAFEGAQVASRLGCFGCHGPSGMGGVPNPGSFKGHIPSWSGEEFTSLVRDEAELREWILTGKSQRLWANPAARIFLDQQRIPMPPYRDHISEDEMKKLLAYFDWLRKR